MTEIWKDVIGYEGIYVVSNLCRVKSIRFERHKILAQHDNARGYLQVSLYKGVEKKKYAHRLMAKAFIPNPDKKPYINHKNGDKKDNRIENLEWCTHAENIRHSNEMGLVDIRGEKSHSSKLTKLNVLKIRRASKLGGIVRQELAEKYNVHPDTISDVISRKTWKHI